MLTRFTLGAASLAAVVALSGMEAKSADILGLGDVVLAIDSGVATNSNSPANEGVALAIDDNPGSKYLNFATNRTGFIVTPGTLGAVQSFIMTTGNDAPGRDPSSYELYGTNEAITTLAHQNGREQNWSLISSGALALPGDPTINLDQRGVAGPAVGFANATAYSSYKMIFPTTKNANSIMQFAEIGLYSSMDGTGTDLTMPGNAIIPIQDIDYVPQSNYPAAENPRLISDNNVDTKYLNGGGRNSGFIVTPVVGSTIVDGFQITTANDFPIRDPASYQIYGTNEPITAADNSFGTDNSWTLIQSGALTLPEDRLTPGGVIPITGNTTAYSSYKVVFPDLKDNNTIMQIAEFELFTPTQATLLVDRQTGNVTLRAETSITLDSIGLASVSTNALDDSDWSPVNGAWTVSTTTSSMLTQTTGGAGLSLTAGNTLDLGNVWRAVTPNFEDIRAIVTNNDGLPLGIDIQYTGTPAIRADYDGNGTVGPEDWLLFREVLGNEYAGQTAGAAYLGGDLDADFDSDIDDFNLFLDIFFAAGNLSLDGTAVPEPSSVVLVLGTLAAGFGWRRLRSVGVRALTIAVAFFGIASQVEAQTFTLDNTIIPVVTIPAEQQNETATSGPDKFFDDAALNDPLDNDLFFANYNGAGVVSAQYAGLGADPKVIFMDYGTPINPNWFAYAQRSGGDPTADRVGKFEFWFSNTDFGGTLPNTAPDSVLQLDRDDERIRDSILRPYTLGSDSLSGRYVAMRLTVSDLSASRPVNNIGGHEFRFLDGPSDVVLTVNRNTGALSLRNNGGNAQAIEMQAYEIESNLAAFDPAAFNGLAGDVAGFTVGNGTSDGWETTGNSAFRLIEANFFAADMLPTGINNVPLGNALLTSVPADDITFRWTNRFGDVFDGRVEYIGDLPSLNGDYNDDGIVNLADYTVWRDNLGASITLPGDSTPGTVTAADYTVWKNNFGAGSPGAASGLSSTNVPEPSTLLLLAAAALPLALRRRAS